MPLHPGIPPPPIRFPPHPKPEGPVDMVDLPRVPMPQRLFVGAIFLSRLPVPLEMRRLQMQIAVKGRRDLFIQFPESWSLRLTPIRIHKHCIRCVEREHIVDLLVVQVAHKTLIQRHRKWLRMRPRLSREKEEQSNRSKHSNSMHSLSLAMIHIPCRTIHINHISVYSVIAAGE